MFVVMMASRFATAGAFLFVQFRTALAARLDNAARSQAADVGALVARGHCKAIQMTGTRSPPGAVPAGPAPDLRR